MAGLNCTDLHRIFETLDRDGDGKLSPEELSYLLNKVGVSTDPDDLKASMAPESLDLEEFILFYESSIKPEDDYKAETDLLEAFKVFDQNNDGFITSTELGDVLLRLGLREDCGGDFVRMIRKFDSNSDGRLDFQEFREMMLSTIA
ncbi:probable calcium-binding protein CML44 [Aristolochia californica]|uniref:probable calcium-binding protein CML44 n=1 Tax=Aristolochia californica TaxID=171875 RepID=UPI0035DE6380